MLDFEVSICLILGAFCGCILTIFALNVNDESYCVEFYNEHGYVLEECEVYRERLESLGE